MIGSCLSNNFAKSFCAKTLKYSLKHQKEIVKEIERQRSNKLLCLRVSALACVNGPLTCVMLARLCIGMFEWSADRVMVLVSWG